MKDRLKNPFALASVLASVLFLLFLWYLPGGFAVGDASVKIRQAHDLADSGFSSLNCAYPGQEIDPEFRFFPALFPFAHFHNGQCYYQYPFQQSFYNALWYFIGGARLLYFQTFLFGIGLLYLALLLGRELEFSAAMQRLLLFFTAFGTGLVAYSLDINEHTATAFLSSAAIFLAFRRNSAPRHLLLSGALLGLAVFLRAETALLCPLIAGGLFFFGAKETRFRNVWLLGLPFSTLFFAFLLSNYLVIGNPLGFRGVEFVEGQTVTFSDRLFNLWVYLFGRKVYGTLFLETPVFLLSLAGLTRLFGDRNENSNRLAQLYFVSYGYILLIPLIVSNWPGPQYGERFLFNVYPTVATLSVLPLVRLDFSRSSQRRNGRCKSGFSLKDSATCPGWSRKNLNSCRSSCAISV